MIEAEKDQNETQRLKKSVKESPSKGKEPSGQGKESSDREKLQRIREKGLRMYKKRLLQQLEADCAKKLNVINFLFLLCVGIVGLMYYTDMTIVEFKLSDLLK